MTRKRETIDRKRYKAMLSELDGATQEVLEMQLLEWVAGDICEEIDVLVDSLGRVDSESSPRPAERD